MLHRVMSFAAVAATVAAAAGTASAAPNRPRLIMAGNESTCSLNSHRTFRTKLTGWRPNVWVKIEVSYLDNGKAYQFALYNNGLVQVNSHGNYAGRRWTCWPVGKGQYDVPDRKTIYFVYAFTIGAKQTPETAHTTFRVVG